MANAPRLLSGGNPQIAKGYGPAKVEEYLAAVPGWKQDTCRAVHRAVLDALPGVAMAVKWNSPFYGVEEGRWFLSYHCLTRYVKLAFFDGEGLDPPPPVGSKQPNVRYLHLAEGEGLDDTQFSRWVKQAAKLPGVRM